MKIIYGTGNVGKINQVKEFLNYKKSNIQIISLKDIGFNEHIEENGTTFEANSLIKALAIKKFCNENNINEIIMTDDSGLCIDALDGRPGIYSARYAGENATQVEKINKILDEMKDIKDPKRTAKFVCVLTVLLGNNEKIICRGETKGKIAYNPSELGKLTYGPIFIPDGFNKTLNELSPEELGDTHREKALLQMIQKIKEK